MFVHLLRTKICSIANASRKTRGYAEKPRNELLLWNVNKSGNVRKSKSD
jgi:hypothetical protein